MTLPGKQDREYKTFSSRRRTLPVGRLTPRTTDTHSFLSRREQDYVTIVSRGVCAPPFTDGELVAFPHALEDAVPLQDGWRFYRTPRASIAANRNHW